jgi:hypothetical protein
LEEFCKSRQGLYVTNLITTKKYFAVWTLPNAKIINKWKKVRFTCPGDFFVSKSGTEKIPLHTFELVDTFEFPEIPKEYLEEAAVEALSPLSI